MNWLNFAVSKARGMFFFVSNEILKTSQKTSQYPGLKDQCSCSVAGWTGTHKKKSRLIGFLSSVARFIAVRRWGRVVCGFSTSLAQRHSQSARVHNFFFARFFPKLDVKCCANWGILWRGCVVAGVFVFRLLNQVLVQENLRWRVRIWPSWCNLNQKIISSRNRTRNSKVSNCYSWPVRHGRMYQVLIHVSVAEVTNTSSEAWPWNSGFDSRRLNLQIKITSTS